MNISIIVNNNNIRKEGGLAISEALKINETLLNLDLGKIGYENIILFKGIIILRPKEHLQFQKH